MPQKWEKLAKHVTREYKEKGYSEKEAKRIGYATATKILGRK